MVSGILLGTSIATALGGVEGSVAEALISALVAGLSVGTCQAYMLRHLIPRAWRWTAATLVGWSPGMALATWSLGALALRLSTLAETIAVATLAEACTGLAQAPLLSASTSMWRAWPAVSAVGWGVLFPGAVPGAALVWMLRRPAGEAVGQRV